MTPALDGDLQAFVEFWQGLAKGADCIPARSGLDPMALGRRLANIHLLEFETRERLVYRLSGTAEVSRLGQDPKGKDYVACVDSTAQPYIRENLHAIAFHPAGALVETEEIYADKTRRPTRYLALPLRDREAGRDYILSLVSMAGRLDVLKSLPSDADPDERPWHDRIVRIDPVDIGAGTPAIAPYTAPSPKD